MNLFDRYDHLAFNSPYYFKENNKIVVKDTFSKAITSFQQPKVIDPTALSEIMNVGYCFADRTLIQGLSKSPWMARLGEDERGWIFTKIPPHSDTIESSESVANEFFGLLCKELAVYCEGKSCIGVLLSGGMDSRIVSVALNYLTKAGDISAKVVGLTWGTKESRDVVYAKKITEMYKWDWQHFDLSAESLITNIGVAAENGAEFSPVHLHAMPEIGAMKGVDAIIAGSYGDSVGRAEFSGSHVSKISSIDNRYFNRFKVFYESQFGKYFSDKNLDIEQYESLFPREEQWQKFEVQRQSHYMRRMLNPCMGVINQKIPVFQAFTAPSVFGYIWSLSPKARTDELYYHIIQKFGKDLIDIPWARTGLPYFNKVKNKKEDEFTRLNNQYGKWVRDEIYEVLKEKILSPKIERLNLFNLNSLESLLKINKLSKRVAITKLDEQFLWVAAVSEMVSKYDVEGVGDYKRSIKDTLDGKVLSLLYAAIYNAKVTFHGVLK